jgi:integrase
MRRARGEGNITLHKPSGRWQVKVSTGQHDAQGQLVFRYGSAKTQEDAVIVKRDLLRLIAEQRLPDQHRLTVKQYLEQWLEDKKGSWKLRTHELNTFYVTKYIVPCIGPVLLTKLSALQVSKMQGDILQKVGATTAVRARGLLVQALTQAERWNLVSRNIAKNVDPVKIEAREMSVWQPEQAQRFLEFARKHRLYPIIHLALTTGMRRGELLGLRWTDIKDGALRIAQSLTVAGDDSLRFSTPKTKKGIRRVPLDPETIGVLEDHRRDQRAAKLELGSVWQEHGLVFPSSLGGPYHPRNFYRDWKVLVEQSGLPYIRPHDLRHTYISLMIYAGADVLLIADRVGHSRPSIPTDKYGHVFDAQRDAGAMPLSKLLKPKKSEKDQPEDQSEDQPETPAEDGTEDPEKAEKS